MPWLYLLAAWVLMVLVASAAYAWWNRTGLRLHLALVGGDSDVDDLPEGVLRTAPQTVVFERDAVELELRLDTSRAAQGPAWITGRVAGLAVTTGTALISKPRWRHALAIGSVRRGPLGATGWTLTTSDPLGFFVSRRTHADAEVGVVYPRFASLSHRHPVRELETAAAAPRAGSGNELFGIREFRPGDSLRRIHWRSSARHGELVVREYEPPSVRAIRIAVDPKPPTADVADQIARIAASEAWDCVREGGRVALGVIESRDLWELLEWLARYPAVEFGDPSAPANVVVTADATKLDPHASINWLVGQAAVQSDVAYERAGTEWPL